MREELDFFLTGVENVEGSGRLAYGSTRRSESVGGEGGWGRWLAMMDEL